MALPGRFPLVRITFQNASLLSTVYLLAAVAAELARRYHPTAWAKRASLAFEALPARTLEVLGLMQPLRRAYFHGELSEFWVRLAFGATAVLLIFVMAVVVGSVLATLRRWLDRKAARAR